MADVFLGVAQGPAGFSKLQVIKQLRNALTEEAEFLTMFLDEARLAARLNHRNVVQTNEVGDVGGKYFIAMEYLDGQPLNRILRQCKKTNAPPLGILLRIVADALAGLHYAHELADYDGTPLNVVHRDASPHNIFVTYEGQTKVVDFGIAKAATRSAETRSGLLKGKVSYMAPEQASARREVDRRADVFVLGAVLWEVVANRRMWEGHTEMDILTRFLSGEVPKLHDACPNAPSALIKICTRATAIDPTDRYATAAEMRNAILNYLEQSGQRVTTEDVGRFVSQLFADRRRELQTTIDRQLSKLTSSSSPVAVDQLLFEPPSTRLPLLNASMEISDHTPSQLMVASRSQLTTNPGQTSAQRPSTPMSLSASASLVTPASMTHPKPIKRRYQFLAVVLVAMVATVATLRLTKQASPESTGVATTASAHVASVNESAAPPPPPPSEPPPRASEMMELRIETDPSSAKLYLDGARLPANPFSAKFPADGTGHRIRAEAAGYTPQSKIVIFDKDITLKLDLEQPPVSIVRGGRGRPVVAAPPPPPPPQPTPTPVATASPTSTTSATAAAKPKRALESANPWGNQAAPTTDAPIKPKRPLENPWAP
jgi:eukaryotic-like serine/threonine-protein kinase